MPSGKWYKLFGNSDGPSFGLSFKEFTSDGTASEAEKDSLVLEIAFLNRFFKKEESRELIREATVSVLNQGDI